MRVVLAGEVPQSPKEELQLGVREGEIVEEMDIQLSRTIYLFDKRGHDPNALDIHQHD